ncbi:cellulose synthase-like protein E6 [Salvia miltiorrhiza]|uniref:cellulose synthase-like protein E6 n=1 Tax=Salvia miltiorrhiza TaxID=226208 RepID=UPI0025ABF9BF|nr:cellulose synthase-like protein E6 [Salvia miltiorrhiza]
MEKSLPLNDWQVKKRNRAINRLHGFIHGGALAALFYYRITTITAIAKSSSPILPHLLIFAAELTLSCMWLLTQASLWNPVARNAYPERLPGDDNLPAIDVFVCTADPVKEPSLGVMNTVISAMALDYPPHKLHLYLSDDGGSPVTLRALRRARSFAKRWIPFCRKFGVKNRCPQAYFLREEIGGNGDHDFFVEKKAIEKAYDDFKISLDKIVAEADVGASRDHSPIVEVISDANSNGTDSSNDEEMPLVVYVAREKRPSHPHNFKAGALNVLLRVSGMISNSPYILTLDCDMYCNDPTSARQAMCFNLDPKLSQNLAFVQFPQRFHNIRRNPDIYDGALRFLWTKWEGFDGLRGPVLSGTGFYIKREALYGTRKLQSNVDLNELKKYYGLSNEFINSIYRNHKPNSRSNALLNDEAFKKEVKLVASCSYDNGSQWGKEVGYRYFAVVEDYFTGFNLHCEGWISVYVDPSRPCFLGTSPLSLGEILVQSARWYLGLAQIALSKYSPIIYGALRMSILQSMVYAEIAFYAVYFLPVYVLALIPPLCLLRGVPLYPEVSSPFFAVFVFVFLSSQLKHAQEVLASGDSIKTWWAEQRVWMMKSLTSYLFASVNASLEKMGLNKASFVPTNKVTDDEAEKLYQMGKYDFQAPPLFMLILCTLYLLNLASFVVGFVKILQNGKMMNAMVMQAFLPLYGVVLHLPLMEGMVLRKDKGRVSPSVSLLSAVISSLALAYAAIAH